MCIPHENFLLIRGTHFSKDNTIKSIPDCLSWWFKVLLPQQQICYLALKQKINKNTVVQSQEGIWICSSPSCGLLPWLGVACKSCHTRYIIQVITIHKQTQPCSAFEDIVLIISVSVLADMKFSFYCKFTPPRGQDCID